MVAIETGIANTITKFSSKGGREDCTIEVDSCFVRMENKRITNRQQFIPDEHRKKPFVRLKKLRLSRTVRPETEDGPKTEDISFGTETVDLNWCLEDMMCIDFLRVRTEEYFKNELDPLRSKHSQVLVIVFYHL